MARSDGVTELRRDLAWLRSSYERRYGCAVWDVRCRENLLQTEVVVSGYVLLESQRRAVERAVAKRLERRRIYYCEIEALAESSASARTGWGSNADVVLNVYRRPLPITASTSELERNLSTQIRAFGSPFRILSECSGWVLVQLDDSTLGWAPRHLIQITNAGPANSWASVERSTKGTLQLNSTPEILIEHAKEYIGVPYVLGGVTKSGIDCSGLMQTLYRDALGLVLPKHSRDQMFSGEQLAFENRQPGDLVFISNGSSELHVGLLAGDRRVIHASRRQGFVISEEMSRLPVGIKVVSHYRKERH